MFVPWTYAAFETPGLVAEILPPTSISGCIPGGPSSIGTTYSESTSETRSRSVESSIKRDFSRSFGEQFEQSYSFADTQSFSETRSQMVTTGNTASIGASETVTDLFSATNSLSRGTKLGWEIDERRGTTGTSSITGSRDRRTDHLNTFEDSGSGQVSPAIFSFSLGSMRGGTRGTADTIGSSRTQSLSNEAYIENEIMGDVSFGEQYSTTVGQNRERGRTWGFSRSFEEQVGFSFTQSLSQTQTFGESLQTSQTIGTSLGTTESEVVTQSSEDTISQGLSAHVWANQQGMWFRQTTRIAYFGAVIALDLCGNGVVAGEVQSSEWTWAADLGIGDTCPPPSNFPPPNAGSNHARFSRRKTLRYEVARFPNERFAAVLGVAATVFLVACAADFRRSSPRTGADAASGTCGHIAVCAAGVGRRSCAVFGRWVR